MGKLEHMSTLELIATIEAKNHRFKIAGFIFAGCIAIGLVILLVLGLSTLSGVDTQLAQQKTLLNSQRQILDNIKTGSDDNAAHVKDLQNHIDCIVELLRQPNRQNLTLKDLNGCQFDSNGNITTGAGVNNGQANSPTGTRTGNNNGGAVSAAPTGQPAPQSTTKPATPPQTSSQNPLIRTTDGLFCPISLTSFACTR